MTNAVEINNHAVSPVSIFIAPPRFVFARRRA